MNDLMGDLRHAMSAASQGAAAATMRLSDGLRANPDAPASVLSRARDAQKILQKEAEQLALEIAIWERSSRDDTKETSE